MHQSPPPLRLDPDLDARLVRDCLAGSAKAWEALVRRHERLVFAVARSYRLPDPDLEDVFQEVFTALVRGLPRLRDARALVRWLASTSDRIARAAALRHRRERAMLEIVGEVPEPRGELRPPESPIGAELERLEQQALLRLAVGSLRTRCRELLAALYYESPTPSYQQLSRRFGVPIGSLGPTRARCFESLRKLISADPSLEGGITPGVPFTSSSESGDRPSRRAAAAPHQEGPAAREVG